MPAKQAFPKAKSGNVFGHVRKQQKTFRAGLYARVSVNDQQTLAMRSRAMREYTSRCGKTHRFVSCWRQAVSSEFLLCALASTVVYGTTRIATIRPLKSVTYRVSVFASSAIEVGRVRQLVSTVPSESGEAKRSSSPGPPKNGPIE